MAKKEAQREMTKEQIKSKLEKFKTDSEKIKYLQSIEPKANMLKINERKAYYETLAGLYLKKEDLENAAEYYSKAGIENKAKALWKSMGDVEMAYNEPVSARVHYKKANEFEKEKQAIEKQRRMSLAGMLNLILAFVTFFFSFIFLSGRITGNVISNSSFTTSSIIGIGLFVLGLTILFVRSERKNIKSKK
jgi:tetratricopeptide (TPR) repeat protein